MEGWRREQEMLSTEIEELTNKVEDERKKITFNKGNEISALEKTMKDKLNELNKRFDDLHN